MKRFQFKYRSVVLLLMAICAVSVFSCGDEGDDKKDQEARERELYERKVDSAFVNIGQNRADFDYIQMFGGTERQWIVALRKSDNHLLVSFYDKAHSRLEMINTDYVIAPSYKGFGLINVIPEIISREYDDFFDPEMLIPESGFAVRIEADYGYNGSNEAFINYVFMHDKQGTSMVEFPDFYRVEIAKGYKDSWLMGYESKTWCYTTSGRLVYHSNDNPCNIQELQGNYGFSYPIPVSYSELILGKDFTLRKVRFDCDRSVDPGNPDSWNYTDWTTQLQLFDDQQSKAQVRYFVEDSSTDKWIMTCKCTSIGGSQTFTAQFTLDITTGEYYK